MNSGFTPDAGMTGPPRDPTKHVNYTLGMILGVDEFTQEFAYLSERDRWAVRDLAGYGTVWGLGVRARLNGGEPEIAVEPGVAISPRGRLIRVTPAQCAAINAWLLVNTQALVERGVPSVGLSTQRLYVVLCYRECETDLLPIPGEPCRSEADSLKASRVTDDFKLELRFSPPDQTEEEAIIDFVAWLRRHIEVTSVPGSSAPLATFLAGLRQAVVPPPLSPPAWPPFSPGSPPDFVLDDSPLSALSVFSGDLPVYLREAFRIWVTELRPLWRPNFLGEAHSCNGALAPELPSDADCVLLAELDVPLTRAPGDQQWFVEPAAGPDPLGNLLVDERRRPWLLSTRLLSEWLLSGEAAAAQDVVRHAASGGPFTLLAAGWVPADPSVPSGGYNGLRAVSVGPGNGEVAFTFDGISDPGVGATGKYVVNCSLAAPPPPAVEPALSASSLVFVGFRAAAGALPTRFVVRVSNAGVPASDALLARAFFMIQVSQYQ